ncbi:MAG: AarF/ABC1/UbiB kinase family protein [Anaerolineae bacterium]|nr:AarF/ABC1/UbiB kinase family protein [Anaerolineae bacterium]
MSTPPPESYRLNRRRYLRIVAFFGLLAVRLIWWYVIVQQIAGRGFVRAREQQRFRRWSRAFRDLAVRMGGVMIKLGQFVSSRVDVLPPAITEELAGLHDEVPTVPFDQMARTLHDELGADWRARFARIDETPVAAASLGQAHRAQLPNEDRVVVKVQRPGIEAIVHTDLAALVVVARLAMRFRFIRRRVNLPLLLDEFARVLWEEVDYVHEADNADRFAELFAEDMDVYIPAVYREHSTRRVLVLEDVTAIKLNDYAAIEAAGIDRRIVAQRLLDTYLRQIFVYRFFHADPHPGNIFIYPLSETSNGKRQRQNAPRPFYIIFIDFGMVGKLTPQIAEGLREVLIGVITRDTRRLMRSYQQLGVLLPDADLKRIEQASEALFDEVWGLNMTQLAEIDYQVMAGLAREFGDLLYTLPFQVPQDFVYLGRAVGILSGMCTGLDPQFDPWAEIQPFVRDLLRQDGGESGEQPKRSWLGLLDRFDFDTLRTLATPETVTMAVETGRDMLLRSAGLPAKADNVLTKLERGDLEMMVRPDDRFEAHLTRIEGIGRQIALSLVFAGTMLTSAFLYVNGEHDMGLVGFAVAGITLVGMLLRGRG